MSHLGDDVSALVDGQLPPERAEEALAHLVGCEPCAREVANERASRRRLAQARDVAPSAELTHRLMRMAHEPPPPEHRGRTLVDLALQPLTSGRTRRRLAVRSVLVLAGVAGVAGVLTVVGMLTERTGDPALMVAQLSGAGTGESRFVVSADTPRTAAIGGPTADTTHAALGWLAANGWSAPSRLPDDLRVSHVGTVAGPDGQELLEIELLGDGHQVVVLEQRGVLDGASLAELPAVDLGGHEAYQLPVPGIALVLQCGDITVLVAGPGGEDDAVRAVAGAFPVTEPGSGMTDRLGRGWQTLVGWTDLIAR
ncbi:anti-sigma factor family protein [Georgenia thermotolerans]|uniref:Putative zinc-finger domain-containing protein n=1 Tax=Georgenia thermotolerans TaxID=527326 RepID=A0A7J5UKC6_9MICO|nr:zf-HC2 domain-containing protein [Georgenia thermotolerans]KAE8762584.1 hypothetical protein GB883_18555 [Georgenia thermotolerans]